MNIELNEKEINMLIDGIEASQNIWETSILRMQSNMNDKENYINEKLHNIFKENNLYDFFKEGEILIALKQNILKEQHKLNELNELLYKLNNHKTKEN